MRVSEIFANNKEWVEEKLSLDKDYFTNLAKGQSPEILYIGCSDSRVTAEELMGLEPGEAFIHRNIANLIPNNDQNIQGVINYAIVRLKVKRMIILGHYGCGGVKAAMTKVDFGPITPWLSNIRDIYRLHRQELDAIKDEDARYKRLVEINVQEQCVNALMNSDVQNAFLAGNLKIHGWVFDMASGKIIDLEIDPGGILEDLGEIIRLR